MRLSRRTRAQKCQRIQYGNNRAVFIINHTLLALKRRPVQDQGTIHQASFSILSHCWCWSFSPAETASSSRSAQFSIAKAIVHDTEHNRKIRQETVCSVPKVPITPYPSDKIPEQRTNNQFRNRQENRDTPTIAACCSSASEKYPEPVGITKRQVQPPRIHVSIQPKSIDRSLWHRAEHQIPSVSYPGIDEYRIICFAFVMTQCCRRRGPGVLNLNKFMV